MSTSTVSPVTNTTTVSTTKSREQILIQSSGAMIAVIVIGIIIILSILLIILKTYNRKMHTARMLGTNSSKPRKNTGSTVTTTRTHLQMENIRGINGLGSFSHSPQASVTGFRLPRAEVPNREHTPAEQLSTSSGSTVVTIHGAPSIRNT